MAMTMTIKTYSDLKEALIESRNVPTRDKNSTLKCITSLGATLGNSELKNQLRKEVYIALSPNIENQHIIKSSLRGIDGYLVQNIIHLLAQRGFYISILGIKSLFYAKTKRIGNTIVFGTFLPKDINLIKENHE